MRVVMQSNGIILVFRLGSLDQPLVVDHFTTGCHMLQCPSSLSSRV